MDFKIFDSLLEPVFAINSDRKIVYCNEPAALICEMSARKLSRGQVFDEVLKFETPVEFLQSLESVQDSSPYQEISFQSTEGKTGKAQITAQKLDSDSPTWLIYLRDVTLEETLQKKYRAELEQVQHYSKNLEKMVDERTAEIRKLNLTMSALLDSLHSGFFIFNTEGTCLEVYSKACERTVECRPAGQKIWDVLKLQEKQVPGFKKWMTTVFAEMLPFEDLSPLAPQDFAHSERKSIQLEYYPLRSQAGAMEAVVVVATDITSLKEAQNEAESERAYAKMILQLVKNKRQVSGFIRESQDLLQSLQLELQKQNALDQQNSFRILHTLKGGSATFSIKSMADLCHQAEGVLSNFQWDGVTAEGVARLGELSVKIQNSFSEFQINNKEILGPDLGSQDRMLEISSQRLMAYRDSQLQMDPKEKAQFTQDFLMEPVLKHFEYYNDVLKNVAVQLGKEVQDIVFQGADLLILPEAYETLFSTFVHAFRNSVDHGFESPDARLSVGKPSAGLLKIGFEKKNQSLLISVQDDGAGIDPVRIREKLKSKGISVEQESDHQVIQHIFDSQFSTRDQVTETSGRGVGMDAIAFAAQNLGGKAWVESQLGVGSTLWVEVPYLTEVFQSLTKAA